MFKALALDNFLLGIFPQPKAKTTKFQSVISNKSDTNFYLALSLVAVNVFLLGSYIYGVNNYASKGYEIRTMQSKISDLDSNIKDLKLQVAKATSMTNIQTDFAATNYVPAGTPKFLQTPSSLTYNAN